MVRSTPESRHSAYIDNFEQILAAAPKVAKLLASCAGLKILVTSRAPLQIRDEHEFPVLPLALPDSGIVHTLETLSDCASVDLFVERAASVQPDFTLSNDNASDLADICTRLDGLPLALELAAARLRLLDPKEMLARLEHRLPLLVGGARDLPRRQQTLRATIAWSYDLLDSNEQRLFDSLSVFVGGCTLAAIEAVCLSTQTDSAESSYVLDQVDSLLAKNLLRQVEGMDGNPRLLMLETLREFGMERSDAEGKTAALRRRHAEYFFTLAEQADPNLRGAGQLQWLDRLEAEHANLRAAMAWSLEPGGEAEFGLRIATVLAWFWRLRGFLNEGRGWLEVVLAACPDRTLLRSKALARATLLTYGLGDNVRALSLAEESLAIAREIEDNSAIAWALHAMGRLLHSNVEYTRASVVLEESLERFKSTSDTVGCAYSSWYLGNALRELSNYTRAAQLFADALRFARQAEDTWAIASSILQAGVLAQKRQELEKASALLKESVAHFRDIRAPWGMWFPLTDLIAVAAKQGYAKRAAQLAGAEQALRTVIGCIMGHNHRIDYENGMAIARQALSKQAFTSAFEKGNAMTTEQAADYALSSEDERRPPSAHKIE